MPMLLGCIDNGEFIVRCGYQGAAPISRNQSRYFALQRDLKALIKEPWGGDQLGQRPKERYSKSDCHASVPFCEHKMGVKTAVPTQIPQSGALIMPASADACPQPGGGSCGT